ncbi:hypothetical protein AMAG_06521 [Allomyces macrogynus ATCC 38327]|uniref:Uncharacterized protein n=1 Tax=Allomyces macrogynus (strain ATCC 38327) TaxID=578462 RepID=A0A0L0SH72_ALLM3|nr:hypothetical protein AMAG_06521 [Allomyces macrogynus ATCC 38327]|eukprot:KNE61720.1 hypothetical protein AMAG_06521 [Allomyces macrogynus ATCC 38327]
MTNARHSRSDARGLGWLAATAVLAMLAAAVPRALADCCSAVSFSSDPTSPSVYTALVSGRSTRYYTFANGAYQLGITFPSTYSIRDPTAVYVPATWSCARVTTADHNTNSFNCSYATTAPTRQTEFGLQFSLVVPPNSGASAASPHITSLLVNNEMCMSTAKSSDLCPAPIAPSSSSALKIDTPIALGFLGTYPLYVVAIVGGIALLLLIGFAFVCYRNHRGNPERQRQSAIDGSSPFAPTLPAFIENDRRAAAKATNRTSFWAKKRNAPPPSTGVGTVRSAATASSATLVMGTSPAPTPASTPTPAPAPMERKNGEWVYSHAATAPRPLAPDEIPLGPVMVVDAAGRTGSTSAGRSSTRRTARSKATTAAASGLDIDADTGAFAQHDATELMDQVTIPSMYLGAVPTPAGASGASAPAVPSIVPLAPVEQPRDPLALPVLAPRDADARPAATAPPALRAPAPAPAALAPPAPTPADAADLASTTSAAPPAPAPAPAPIASLPLPPPPPMPLLPLPGAAGAMPPLPPLDPAAFAMLMQSNPLAMGLASAILQQQQGMPGGLVPPPLPVGDGAPPATDASGLVGEWVQVEGGCGPNEIKDTHTTYRDQHPEMRTRKGSLNSNDPPRTGDRLVPATSVGASGAGAGLRRASSTGSASAAAAAARSPSRSPSRGKSKSRSRTRGGEKSTPREEQGDPMDPRRLAAMGVKPNSPATNDRIRQWASTLSSFDATPPAMEDGDEDDEAPLAQVAVTTLARHHGDDEDDDDHVPLGRVASQRAPPPGAAPSTVSENVSDVIASYM